MVKKAQPVFDKAREVIRESRFEFAGMQGMKGTVVDRTRKTLKLPTGKLDGLLDDVTRKVNRIS
jgi:RNase P/RNase MRP subunit p29